MKPSPRVGFGIEVVRFKRYGRIVMGNRHKLRQIIRIPNIGTLKVLFPV
jgi:hypothetical protein